MMPCRLTRAQPPLVAVWQQAAIATSGSLQSLTAIPRRLAWVKPPLASTTAKSGLLPQRHQGVPTKGQSGNNKDQEEAVLQANKFMNEYTSHKFTTH
jgi:hypothetical protein